jgi:pyruvate/2-oxoglutarate dehydrogenase complex dihydrolipoamide acyltransferase (E2) component
MESPEVYSKIDDGVTRGEDIMNNQEETMISSSSPSYDNPPTEQTVATTLPSFDHHRYEQNYQQQQREKQQFEINRALEETRDNIRKSTVEARKDIPRFTSS